MSYKTLDRTGRYPRSPTGPISHRGSQRPYVRQTQRLDEIWSQTWTALLMHNCLATSSVPEKTRHCSWRLQTNASRIISCKDKTLLLQAVNRCQPHHQCLQKLDIVLEAWKQMPATSTVITLAACKGRKWGPKEDSNRVGNIVRP